MTNLVRSASLTSFAEVAGACALNVHALLSEVGLPGRCLADPGAVAIENRQERVLTLRGAGGKLLQGRRADEK